jgi:alkylated DNA nucleotide flippase Atl1
MGIFAPPANALHAANHIPAGLSSHLHPLMDLKKLNIFTGWLVFLVAAWTYISTIEPTASFWDCGEFIATAYKLQVGHPPGAPLFMILGRVSSFFVAPEHVAVAVNVLSALASAFTILFLFWSITHMAQKLATRNGAELTNGSIFAILGSGVVGALAYTWSDSFWFSAVEGEVYALSSFFTAIVFWAILKWESEADRPHSTRWLILIAYLMGLSIGVHLLNLLCIPAIAFVYYFKRYPVSPRGIITTFIISAVILGTIQAVIIPGIVRVAGWFELLFVNDMGLPFNTGNAIYAALLIGGIVWLLRWTQTNGKVVLNTVVLGVTVILIGYSTYAMIVIRSAANPPIDENNPENVFNLLSYLNREQYGDRPLLIGQFWDSPYSSERKDGKPVYTATWVAKKDNREVGKFYDRWSARHFLEENPGHTIEHAYLITDPRKGTEVVYEPEFTMLFPRMYSTQRNHVDAYKDWSQFKGVPMRTTDREGKPTIIYKPTFVENMRYFFAYQMDWMYWRYFMWNFAGRQNDQQGHGSINSGNWISGIKAIDAQRLGNQDHLPPSMTNNKAHNRFYLLPLLLGVIGLVYQMLRHLRDWTVVMLLFFFTGIAIVIYLNQAPYQPRERDYAYVGSFYAFAIWIGLGVYALYDAARSLKQRELMNVVGVAIGIGVLKFVIEWLGGGDHATSLSLLYMAVVGGAALALFHFMGRVLRNDAMQGILATAVGMAVPIVMVADGWDDHDRSIRKPARDLASNYLESCAPNGILFTNGDNDTFPLWYAQEVEGIRTDVRVVNLSLLNTDWYVDQMRRKAYDSDPVPFNMPHELYRQGTRDVVALIPQGDRETYRDIKEMMAFVYNDRNMQPIFSRGQKDAWFPTDRFSIPVDSAKVFSNGTLSIEDTAVWVPEVRWQIRRQVLLKNHLMVLDLLAHNDWDRPIYFAVTTGPDSYINLQDHFQLEGLTYRLVPVYTPSDPRNPNLQGRVATDTMYRNVTERFLWGNMDSERPIYLDENVLRMTTNLRLQLSSLAEALIEEGRDDMARTILDISLEKMPEHNVPFDRILLPTVEAYYAIGDTEKGTFLSERLFTIMEEDLTYYLSLEPRFVSSVGNDMAMAHAVMGRLMSTTVREDPEAGAKLRDRFQVMDEAYQDKLMELEAEGRRTTRMRF